MIEHITTAPKDGTKILCICSDGEKRYCWWFGCSPAEGFWMTEEAAEPVSWFKDKHLPPSLKEQALKELKDWTDEKHGPGGEVHLCEGLSVAIIRRALESLPY